jgi:hypothetical protein
VAQTLFHLYSIDMASLMSSLSILAGSVPFAVTLLVVLTNSRQNPPPHQRVAW